MRQILVLLTSSAISTVRVFLGNFSHKRLFACLGCLESNEISEKLRKLFETDNFKISVVHDPKTVEVCGALKVVYFSSNFI